MKTKKIDLKGKRNEMEEERKERKHVGHDMRR